MKRILETERLVLREFNFGDAAFIIELLNSPGWLQFIGDRGVKTIEDAKTYLQNGPMKSYEANGFGLSLVSLKENETPIGMCGLIKRDNLEDVDIGFAFLPGYAGKGYGQEIAVATMTYAKDVLKLKRVVAITTQDNIPSQKLLQKIGMQFEKITAYENEELMLFATTAS